MPHVARALVLALALLVAPVAWAAETVELMTADHLGRIDGPTLGLPAPGS